MKRVNQRSTCIKSILSLGFTVTILISVSVLASEDISCFKNETLIAGCHLDEQKQRSVSLCSSANKETITYRFGTPEKDEMAQTFRATRPLFRWIDKATYTTYFGFRTGEYGYVVGVPQQTFGAIAFLEVLKLNKTIMSKTCTANSFGSERLKNVAIKELDDGSVRAQHFSFPP